MTEKHTDSYFEIDESMYLVRETDEDGKAFVLTDRGRLREVSSGYVMAMGSPISKEDFCKEVKKLRGLAQTGSGTKNTSGKGCRTFHPHPKSSLLVCAL